MQSVPLHRLYQYMTPTEQELSAFQRMASETRTLRRRDVIREQGEPVRDIYFLVEGWVAACIELPNKKTQIIKAHLPGDLLGTPSLTLAHAAETLVALTKVSVDVIPIHAFGETFLQMPRLAAAMFLASQQERIAMMDRIASIGRTSALQRLSAFLLNIHDRLKLADATIDGTFELPLSQEQIGNVLGMTTVHVNRTFRDLDRKGLIERKGKLVTLADVGTLRELAAVPKREFLREPDWLFANGAQRSRSHG